MTRGEYSAILYRSERFEVDESDTFWLSSTPEKVSKDWGNGVFRLCTWVRLIEKRSGKAFYVYNTHLDHRSQPSREKSVMLMIERIADRTYSDPFVLTGDFNMAEDNPAILYLKGKPFKEGEEGKARKSPIPLVDSFRVRYPEAQDVATFHWFQGGRYGIKIDSIFVTPETTVLDAAIIRDNIAGRYPSDHYPVTAHLKL
jgi:endonuclease/exonuclease/phosphatase family metal-dependent hydrolase